MTLRAGDVLRQFDRLKHHFVVISDEVMLRGINSVVMVNFTTFRPGADATCVIEPGEHPLVVQRSCIPFAYADWFGCRSIERRLEQRRLQLGPRVDSSLLGRIQRGALLSPDVAGDLKAAVRLALPVNAAGRWKAQVGPAAPPSDGRMSPGSNLELNAWPNRPAINTGVIDMATAGAYINHIDVRPGWPRVNPIAGVMLTALAAMALAYLGIVFVLEAPLFLLVAPVVCAVLGCVVMIGKRWTAIPAGAIVMANLMVEVPNIVGWHLHDGENGLSFALNVVVIPVASVIVGVAAVLYTLRAYRCGDFSLPGWAKQASVAAAAIAIGGSAVAFAPSYGAPARVESAALETMSPSVVMANNEFTQQEVRVARGEVVQWRVLNADNEAHTFDLDGYGIHMTLGGGESGLVMFVADEAGTFDITCSIPGHTMSSTLIVE